ncbi:hypothetical protein CEXT_121611 [Caerostris extrusa]|uniref:Uncharacterized protein n=1 Tax=Caerostris extrusa TaxID=172846 RepID=A0AAV4RMH9_CAEEX|nr:hypothetical protein CEXT_121611 [Caerostris extrusa]
MRHRWLIVSLDAYMAGIPTRNCDTDHQSAPPSGLLYGKKEKSHHDKRISLKQVQSRVEGRDIKYKTNSKGQFKRVIESASIE